MEFVFASTATMFVVGACLLEMCCGTLCFLNDYGAERSALHASHKNEEDVPTWAGAPTARVLHFYEKIITVAPTPQ